MSYVNNYKYRDRQNQELERIWSYWNSHAMLVEEPTVTTTLVHCGLEVSTYTFPMTQHFHSYVYQKEMRVYVHTQKKVKEYLKQLYSYYSKLETTQLFISAGINSVYSYNGVLQSIKK